jgi:hypothetical protein
MDIPTPTGAAIQITEILMPFISMMLIVIIGLMIKDFGMKAAKGVAFAMNKSFQEGDKVILDGERALIVKIGVTQTVFGIIKEGGSYDGDYVWRYVPNERIPFLKLEKIVFDNAPHNNKEMILGNQEAIEEIKNGRSKHK